MRILLIQNVSNLGQIGEIKEVKEGYALNYLLPQKLAVLPNSPKAAEIIAQKKAKHQAENLKVAEKDASAAKITGQKLVFLAKADTKGKLYGSIGPKEISARLGIAENLIKEHYKKIGKYQLKINLGKNQPVEVKIEIKKS